MLLQNKHLCLDISYQKKTLEANVLADLIVFNIKISDATILLKPWMK